MLTLLKHFLKVLKIKMINADAVHTISPSGSGNING